MSELEQWARQRLIDLGWSNEAPGVVFSLEACLIEYQQFHALPVTGELDDATVDSLQRPRFCAHPDRMALGEYRRVPSIAWQFRGPTLPTVPLADLRQAIQMGFNGWSGVAPIEGHEAVAGEQVGLQVVVASIDGRNGVLADCELPGPALQHMRLDGGEGYTIILPPNIPGGMIGLVNVLTHELGHAFGLDHLTTPHSLMNPYYDPMIVNPQAGDIQAIQRLYPGAPYKPPTPAPTPTPGPAPTPQPGESVASFTVYGARKIEVYANGKLQKVAPA